MITVRATDVLSGDESEAIAKLPVIADTKGRLRVTKAQRRDILTALARSGESLPRFAQRTGIKYATLARWVQNSRSKRCGRPPRVQLLEAVVDSTSGAATDTSLILQLPGGVRMEVANEKQAALAAALVRALGQPC